MAKFDPRMAMYEEQTRFSGVIYLLMLVVIVAFAGFVWNFYSGGETPRIAPPPGAYKVAPPPDAPNAPDEAENALYDALESQAEQSAATPRPAPEAPMDASLQPAAPETTPRDPATGAPRIAPDPTFVANGPYVAQLAALQSEAAVDAAWARLATRAPGLFARARLDVERADLGPRGIYFRVRAGYFADRANANRFCDRIEQMGQDCIVVQR